MIYLIIKELCNKKEGNCLLTNPSYFFIFAYFGKHPIELILYYLLLKLSMKNSPLNLSGS